MNAATAKADMAAQIKKAQEAFAMKAKAAHGSTVANVATACRLVENTAKLMMHDTEVDTSVTYGKRGHHPSVPGAAPAVDNGTLRRSITHSVDVEGDKTIGRVGSTITSPPYGKFLEEGTTKMKPRPWLLPSLDANREQIKELLNAGAQGRTVEMEMGDAGD